jgi:hypothetical protein
MQVIHRHDNAGSKLDGLGLNTVKFKSKAKGVSARET